MKTIDQLKAEQAAELTRHALRLAFSEQAPAVPDNVHLFGRVPRLKYAKQPWEQAFSLCALFDVVPTYIRRAGCTYLEPATLPGIEESAEDGGPYAVRVTVEGGVERPCSVVLEFFASVAGQTVAVTVDVAGCDGLAAVRKNIGTEKVKKWRYVPNPAACASSDKKISWHAGPTEGDAYRHTFLWSAKYEQLQCGIERARQQ